MARGALDGRSHGPLCGRRRSRGVRRPGGTAGRPHVRDRDLILRDRGRAEDAVQDALVRAWREMRTLRDPHRFDAWLRRLLVNACFDESRRQRRHAANVRLLPDHDRATPDSSGVLGDRDEMDRAMRQISTDHRAVIVHHYYLELSVAEIADALDIPVGTAKSRLHHARLALRAAMEAGGTRSEGHLA